MLSPRPIGLGFRGFIGKNRGKPTKNERGQTPHVRCKEQHGVASSGKENAQNKSLCVLVPDRSTTGGIMEVLWVGSSIFGFYLAGQWQEVLWLCPSYIPIFLIFFFFGSRARHFRWSSPRDTSSYFPNLPTTRILDPTHNTQDEDN